MGTDIAARIAQTEERIEAACRRCGRSRREVGLMAVTKFQPPQALEAAWQAGIRLFGESRVQEAAGKFGAHWESRAHEGGRLHLIGSLQRNKAKTAAALFDCIQSVDRVSLIEELGALTLGTGRPLMVLLEYHTAEASKAGFPDIGSLCNAAEKVLAFPGLCLSGLMTMAPFTSDEKAIRGSFRSCYNAFAELKKKFPKENISCLSMGMSGDFEIAIQEGSTLIRIGTAIFGETG